MSGMILPLRLMMPLNVAWHLGHLCDALYADDLRHVLYFVAIRFVADKKCLKTGRSGHPQ